MLLWIGTTSFMTITEFIVNVECCWITMITGWQCNTVSETTCFCSHTHTHTHTHSGVFRGALGDGPFRLGRGKHPPLSPPSPRLYGASHCAPSALTQTLTPKRFRIPLELTRDENRSWYAETLVTIHSQFDDWQWWWWLTMFNDVVQWWWLWLHVNGVISSKWHVLVGLLARNV